MAFTHSTEEAIALLNQVRSEQIAAARWVAYELIKRNGSTHSRAVRQEMIRQGIFDTSVSEHWLGCVFRSPEFKFTGLHFTEDTSDEDTARNIHQRRGVKIWTLKEDWL